MLDHDVTHQRSHGTAHVAFAAGGLADLRQSGSARVMVPPAGAPAADIVFLNTSGGLTSGDSLDYGVTLAPGVLGTATTQTAERAYRADGPPARVRVSLRLGHGASLDWLPQDTILFDGAAMDRDTRVDLAPGARFLGIETVVLGRAAMGEVVHRLWFRDRRRVLRDGRPVLVDPFRLDDGALARAGGAALLAGARAFSLMVLVDPAAADAVAPLRAQLTEPGVTGAVSALPGRLVVRCCAADAWPLRRQVIRLLACVRSEPMPRVWQI